MSRDALSITPPLTPDEESDSENGSLDYMKFFNSNQPKHGRQKKPRVEDLEEQSCDNYSKSLWFACQGKLHPKTTIGQDSYLGASALSNLLYMGKPFGDAFPNSKVVFAPDILYEKLTHFFFKIRKSVQILELGSKPFCGKRADGGSSKTNNELRREVVDILSSLSHLLTELNREDDEKFLQQVVTQIMDLIKFLGPAYQLPQHVTNAISPSGNKCLSAAFHLFHLHMDVRWWSMCLLYQLEKALGKDMNPPVGHYLNSNTEFINEYKINAGSESASEDSLFDAYMDLMLWDLITLMERESAKSLITELYYLPYFPCSCGYELALSVLHLSDWRHKFKDKQAFWALVNKKLLTLLKMKKDNALNCSSVQRFGHGLTFPPPTFRDVKIHQIWWMFSGIAKLFQFDREGYLLLSSLKASQMEAKMLRTLILVTISNYGAGSPPSEEELRLYLRCCLALLHLWQGEKEVKQTDWIVALWDHFSKNLDSTFLPKGKTLEGFATLGKSPSSLVDQIKTLSVNSTVGKNESSWNIFLRIVVSLVQHSDYEWRFLKGRIFSKFHSKMMSGLTPMGLYNTVLLFLALANSTDSVSLCVKLCDLLCDVPGGNSKRLYIVALGLVTAVYLLVSKNCHLDCIAEKIDTKIRNIFQQCLAAPDMVERREIAHAIFIFCDGFQEVLAATSDLTLGQSKLFCPGLNQILSQGWSSEQKAILGCLNAALDKVVRGFQLHALADGSGIDILESIRTTFLPTIKTLLRTKTPPALLASICSSLVLTATRFRALTKGDPRVQEATALFTHIVESDVIEGRLTMQFLAEVLAGSDGAEVLQTLDHNYDEKIVSCLLAKMFDLGTCEEVFSASEAIFATPKVTAWAPNPPACPFGAFEMLVQNMAHKFMAAETFQLRMKIRDKTFVYFGPIDKAVVALLRKTPLPSHLPQAMALIGCAFAHATALLYVKGESTCVLARLMSSVILPHSVYNLEKPLGPALPEALVPVLPKIVSGLASLGFASDPYILRCLKDIFASYTHRFSFATHPFMDVLTDETAFNCKEVKRLFVTTITSNFISKRNGNLVHLQLVISLLLELVNKEVSSWLELFCTVTFFHLLDLLLYLDDLHTKRSATDLFQKILREADHSQQLLRKRVVQEIQRFVECNVAWYSQRVFRILDVIAVTSQSTIVQALPGITEAIRKTEEKRGSGLDQTLRKGYNSLLQRLSPQDQERFRTI